MKEKNKDVERLLDLATRCLKELDRTENFVFCHLAHDLIGCASWAVTKDSWVGFNECVDNAERALKQDFSWIE